MLSEPTIQRRSEGHYLAIAKTVHMHDIPHELPPLIPEVKQYMLEHDIEAAGPDFFLYKSMDESGELDCEAGFSVSQAAEGNGHIVPGIFPAGNYASIIYTGDFKDMMEAHVALENYIVQQGLKEKSTTLEGRTEWGGRTEFYLVDPELEPDPEKWQTEIVFLLED
ncbi:GyrI-like domain-containing protein [Dyadobacter sp. CY347]|uniref:GyrI-like domain-containing protein n=1 Tax=Dyadobacter sp. CY347 TaxID=2909336 RepID=UPI001F1E42C5|nr:GyrI-like domain-containing protein [Dyadobacter sp. CY347]MCF2490834.1 GyrI-like domain-containing protein [Dyadobacter sp. CY347]